MDFGGSPVEPGPRDEAGKAAGGPKNRRAEMYLHLRNALEAGRFRLPDDNALQAELVSVREKLVSDGRLQLESKIEMRRRNLPSPDLADAVALCFASPDGFPTVDRFGGEIEYPGYAYA